MGGKAKNSRMVGVRLNNDLADLIARYAEQEGTTLSRMVKRLLVAQLTGHVCRPQKHYPMPRYSCPAAIVAESEETLEQIAAPLGDCGWDVSEKAVGTGIALQKQIYWRVDEDGR